MPILQLQGTTKEKGRPVQVINRIYYPKAKNEDIFYFQVPHPEPTPRQKRGSGSKKGKDQGAQGRPGKESKGLSTFPNWFFSKILEELFISGSMLSLLFRRHQSQQHAQALQGDSRLRQGTSGQGDDCSKILS